MFSLPLMILVGVVTFLLALWFFKRPKGAPPGPRGLPVIGSILSMKENPHFVFEKWAQEYGHVFGFYLGSKFAVVLNSYEAIKEALVKQGDNFAGRPKLFTIDYVQQLENSGIVNSEGKRWSEQRKFSIQVLRNFGVGKSHMEDKIREETCTLISAIVEKGEQPFSLHRLLNPAIANIICQLVYNTRYEYDDENFDRVLRAFDELSKRLGSSAGINFLPWLRFLPSEQQNFKVLREVAATIRDDFLRVQIAAHKKTFNPDHIRDLIDAYFKEIQDKNDQNTSFNEEQLERTVGDMFAAGTETTTTTLRWGFLFLLHHPEVQAKLQQELDTVVGRGRLPAIKDRPNLPFVEATIKEMQRLGNIVPFSLLHNNFEETKLFGYNIPARTMIFPNLYAVHMNPEHFPEPETFRPERFLDENGVVIKDEHLIPFSAGRRVCAGEILAKMELFLFFTGLIQRFTFLPEKVGDLPSRVGVMGLARSPKPYKVVAVAR